MISQFFKDVYAAISALTLETALYICWGAFLFVFLLALVLTIFNAGVRAAMENGGVINDHHGIGLKLSRLMKEQYGPGMQVFEGLKKTLDPNGIMNPYKLGV